MKRASLKVVSNPQPTVAPDLTDRLLPTETARAKKTPGQQATRRPKVKAVESPHPVGERAPRAEAAPRAEPLSPNLLAEAMHHSEAALAALQRAAAGAPSRYDVAVRYRLDALAHHLRQVRDFVLTAKKGTSDV